VIRPNEKLVLFVKFSIGMTLCLSGLEIAYMAFLSSWNTEVFAAITGLIGTVSGVLIGNESNARINYDSWVNFLKCPQARQTFLHVS
jgi:hypothetical protein